MEEELAGTIEEIEYLRTILEKTKNENHELTNENEDLRQASMDGIEIAKVREMANRNRQCRRLLERGNR